MKYAALVYYSEADMAKMSQPEWDSLNQECMACGGSLSERGHLLGGEALHSVGNATTLRVRDKQLHLTDGPFAETKEQLAGFYLLEARDLNEAIQLASSIPPARYGSIEIRPVREVQAMDNPAYSTLQQEEESTQ